MPNEVANLNFNSVNETEFRLQYQPLHPLGPLFQPSNKRKVTRKRQFSKYCWPSVWYFNLLFSCDRIRIRAKIVKLHSNTIINCWQDSICCHNFAILIFFFQSFMSMSFVLWIRFRQLIFRRNYHNYAQTLRGNRGESVFYAVWATIYSTIDSRNKNRVSAVMIQVYIFNGKKSSRVFWVYEFCVSMGLGFSG